MLYVWTDRRTLYEQEVIELSINAKMSEFKIGICNEKTVLTDIDIKGARLCHEMAMNDQ